MLHFLKGIYSYFSTLPEASSFPGGLHYRHLPAAASFPYGEVELIDSDFSTDTGKQTRNAIRNCEFRFYSTSDVSLLVAADAIRDAYTHEAKNILLDKGYIHEAQVTDESFGGADVYDEQGNPVYVAMFAVRFMECEQKH